MLKRLLIVILIPIILVVVCIEWIIIPIEYILTGRCFIFAEKLIN